MNIFFIDLKRSSAIAAVGNSAGAQVVFSTGKKHVSVNSRKLKKGGYGKAHAFASTDGKLTSGCWQ